MTLTFKSAREFQESFKSHELAFLSHYDRAVTQAAAAGQRVIRSKAPVDTGLLRRETYIVVHANGGGARRAVVDLVSGAPYAHAQEYGSRPHLVPIGVLIAWAIRQAPNLGIAKPTSKKRIRFAEDAKGSKVVSMHISSRSGPTATTASPEIISFAYAVQRKIALYGTKATFYVKRSLPELRALLGKFLKGSRKRGDIVTPGSGGLLS